MKNSTNIAGQQMDHVNMDSEMCFFYLIIIV